MNKDVIEVRCAGGTRLILTFEGGEQRDIDIAANFPMDGVFAPLRDQTFFETVRVEPDVGADICPDVLYERSRPLVNAGAPPTQTRTGSSESSTRARQTSE